MNKDRRDFLKLAGVTVAGIGASSAFHALLSGEAAASGLRRAGVVKTKAETRLGMVIDTNKFIEHRGLAQRCIDACHSIHNVPDFANPDHQVKWLWTDKFEHVFVKDTHYRQAEKLQGTPVLALCNHCDNPPCVRVCPTRATFKKADGVVAMDYHRCIGCRFCMAACPYGARNFNWLDPRGKNERGNPLIRKLNRRYPTRTIGVVEKCNFCAHRLAVGELPACVEEAAAYEAIFFGNLNDPQSAISQVLREKFTITRRGSLGTRPSIFYIV